MATNLPASAQAQGGIGTAQVPHIEHDEHLHEHDEHHDQHWMWKYVFSQDHKMIARQFLITGIFWAIVGGTLSSLFRLQLGWPEATMDWLQPFLGKWIEGGKLNPEFYLALVTMHGTIMVFFVPFLIS
jgi:cytochrome c oxidase subunit 1